MPLRDSPVPAPPETPFLDSIVALTRAAAITERIRLGTGILVLPHHNPVVLAKALASLDVVSKGRLIAGFAGGYVEAEFRALGVDFHRRGAITDDSLAAIRTLWTESEPRYAGRFARFDGIRFEPKPVTKPHPPIVIGGQAPAALARAAQHADGWYGFAITVERCAEFVRELRGLRAATSRAGQPLEISLTTFEPLTAELVAQAEAAGIDRLIAYPLVKATELERTVREIGARFAGR